MQPGPNDIRIYLKFEESELELLQDNSYQMAESFGLDQRIDNLTGKRKVGFYLWDLECLEMVVDDLRNEKDIDKNLVNGLYDKIRNAMDCIDTTRKKV